MNKAEQIEAIRPGQFRYLVRLEMARSLSGDAAGVFNLELVLAEVLEGGRSLMLHLSGVTDLRLGHLDNLLGWELRVTWVRSYQLEGVSYEVAEVGHGMLHCFCQDLQWSVTA